MTTKVLVTRVRVPAVYPLLSTVCSNEQAMADDGKKSGMNDYVKAESLVQIAIVLPVACLLGAGLGYLLDKHFGTSWIIVVGIALGAAAGFVSVIRTASSFLKRSGE